MTKKRFTWLKKDCYAPQIIITDSLTEKDLTPIDCYNLLNELSTDCRQLKEENEQLKRENQSWLKTISHFDNVVHKDRDYAKRMYKENEELKKEIAKFKEWGKHIEDIKREDLDIDSFSYCYTMCPYKDRYNGWCYYHNKDDGEIDYKSCEKNKWRIL